jgi:hypothetical protein
MSAFLVFQFPIDATFEQVSEAVAIHFGGEPVNLSTGDSAPMRDPSAVFTGTAALSISSGADVNAAHPTVELDVHGYPWDDRIHSSSKSKNADGSWRGRKGVPPPTITKVKAELASKGFGKSLPPASVAAAASAPTAEQANLNNNDEAARVARIEHARNVAFSKCGAQPCSDDVFGKLQRGQLVTVEPHVANWFTAWQQEFNAAYAAYARETLAENPSVAMGLQAINPDASSNAAVQISGNAQAEQPAAAAPNADTFAGFAAKYGPHLASPALAEVLGTLGVQGGFAGLATQEPMIPAVRALLAAKGIA